MEDIVVVDESIARGAVASLAEQRFGDMVKAVVDVRRRIMAIGGDLHADEEQVLLDRGCRQEDLWGINIYHALPRSEWIEYDSLINIRPSQGNRSRDVEDEGMRSRIREIVDHLIGD